MARVGLLEKLWINLHGMDVSLVVVIGSRGVATSFPKINVLQIDGEVSRTGLDVPCVSHRRRVESVVRAAQRQCTGLRSLSAGRRMAGEAEGETLFGHGAAFIHLGPVACSLVDHAHDAIG